MKDEMKLKEILDESTQEVLSKWDPNMEEMNWKCSECGEFKVDEFDFAIMGFSVCMSCISDPANEHSIHSQIEESDVSGSTSFSNIEKGF